jgi:putative phosphoribosyl transferase
MFKDREEAGKKLAKKLVEYNFKKPIVFGLARGGIVVAKEVARELSAPLDVVVVRKLGVPGNKELGFGAIAPNDVEVINWEIAEKVDITPFDIKSVSEKEKKELERRLTEYRENSEYKNLKGKTAVLVDDGIATGVSTEAAIEFIETLKPEKVVVATPTCATDTAEKIQREVDVLVCTIETNDFWAVGQFYQDFPQTTDNEVKDSLKSFNW